MKREIRFRAWDKERKGFINGFNMIGFSTGQGAPNKKLQRFSDEWNEEEFELMQFTGLHDKNGKEIFEGDVLHVLEVSNTETIEYTSPVEFIDSGFLVTMPDDCQVPLAVFHMNPETCYPLFEIEVIGNIRDNPELLTNASGT